MTFELGLLKQIKRDDPVGDLAKDFAHAQKLSICLGKREKCNDEHLRKWRATPGAYTALKAAQIEYNTQKLVKGLLK